MSLAFTRADATDAVDHQSASSLDNLSAGTLCSWCYTDDTSDGANRLVAKGNNTIVFAGGSTDESFWGWQILRGGVPLDCIVVSQDFAAFGTNKWLYFATAFDLAGANGDQLSLMGDLTTVAAEPGGSGYLVQLVGDSGRTSDAAANFHTGNQGGQSRGFPGWISWIALIAEHLTVAQMQAIQRNAKLALEYDCRIFCHYGLNGLGTQFDWSGNDNHGTVGGTLQVQGDPLGLMPDDQDIILPPGALKGDIFNPGIIAGVGQ